LSNRRVERNETWRADLDRLVSYRYGRGSILITTNKGIAD
jgi:hypothetical protein